MERVHQLIVVEGKTDVARLRNLIDADFYCTNGFYVTSQTVADIIALSTGRSVLLFLDNDSAGERIRRVLQHALPFCEHAYITEPWGKQGQVALASDSTLLNALANVKKVSPVQQALSWREYLQLDLNALHRRALCKALGISFCNAKQFFKRLNMMGLYYSKVDSLLHEGF